MQNHNLPIVKQFKTNREVVAEMVELVFDAISNQTGANVLMLRPALNVAKIKLSQMTDDDAQSLVLQIHKISSLIEKETGQFSPYHGYIEAPELSDTINSL